MEYVICDKCHEYYEFQPGEHPEEFSDECECGGKLRYQLLLNGPVVDQNKLIFIINQYFKI